MNDGVHFLQDLQASAPDVRIGLSRAGVSGVLCEQALRGRFTRGEVPAVYGFDAGISGQAVRETK